MKLPPALDDLSKIKHAKVIGVILALLINLSFVVLTLFIASQTGYIVLMIGTVGTTFAVPYIFGLRDGKILVVVGIILFLITGAINGPLVANKMYSDARAEYENPVATMSDPDPATGDYLANGTITPLEGAIGQTYQFSVWYHSNQTPPTARVQVIYQQHLFYELFAKNMSAADPDDLDYTDGKEFVYTSSATEFSKGIYVHYYELNYTTRTTYLPDDRLLYGPINGDSGAIYGFYAGIGAVSMFCNVGLMFIIVVMLYWWLSSAKKRREGWMDAAKEGREEADEKAAEKAAEKAKPVETESSKDEKETEAAEDEEDEEFTCTSCGGNVNHSANFCPNCGEMIDGVEDEVEVRDAIEDDPEKETSEDDEATDDQKADPEDEVEPVNAEEVTEKK